MFRAITLTLLGLAGLASAPATATAQDDGSGLTNAPGRVSVAPFPSGNESPELQPWQGTGWNIVHLDVITGQLDDNTPINAQLVNGTDGAGLTPLHYAVSMGNSAPVDLLIASGADVNASAYGGFSVLHAACQFGDVAMVQNLLQHGADHRRLYRGDWQWLSEGVLADDPARLRSGMQQMLSMDSWDAGISCLHLAAAVGNSELLTLLLDTGLDPGLQTLMNGVAPLHLCTTQPACTKLLLEAGAQPDPVEDFSGLTPLFGSSFENARLLLAAGANANALNSWGYGYLHTVDSSTMAQLLIDNGADLELAGAYGETPLMSASDRGLENVVRFLLSSGAHVNAADYLARTAMDRARDNDNETIESLLADAGGMAGFELHPLHYTAAEGDLVVLQLAIENGEDVNIADECGWSALHYACMAGTTACADFLLEAGADVNAADVSGATPLSRSTLTSAGLTQLLVDAGADVEARDPWSGTSLLRACSRGNEEVAEILITAGASVNAADSRGQTALMLAAQGGNAVLLQRLLDSGADLNARDSLGQTALMHAIAYSSFYGGSCGRLLLDAGADVHAVDLSGQGMLHHLALRGNVQLASRLVEAGSLHEQTDKRGYSPARLARLAGNEILAAWLETLP